MKNLQSGLFFSLTGITAVASLVFMRFNQTKACGAETTEYRLYNDGRSYCSNDELLRQRYMETPNLDRIANEGVRFTNSFVPTL